MHQLIGTWRDLVRWFRRAHELDYHELKEAVCAYSRENMSVSVPASSLDMSSSMSLPLPLPLISIMTCPIDFTSFDSNHASISPYSPTARCCFIGEQVRSRIEIIIERLATGFLEAVSLARTQSHWLQLDCRFQLGSAIVIGCLEARDDRLTLTCMGGLKRKLNSGTAC